MTPFARWLLRTMVRLWNGARREPFDLEGPAVLFANHGSHLDTLVIWAALGDRVRPVAAADYWGGSIRRWIAEEILGALLIERTRDRDSDPIAQMTEALRNGDVLLLFPEGTRTKPGELATFKGGLHMVGERVPDAQLVPVYVHNTAAAWPKGTKIPLPLICSVKVGDPLPPTSIEGGEERGAFLDRARLALLTLANGRLS